MNGIYEPIKPYILCHHETNTETLAAYHTHDACELYIFINGDANYYIEQKCYHLNRGDILVMQPGEYHRVTLIDKRVYERCYINISNRYFKDFRTELTNLSSCFFDRPFGEQSLIKTTEQELNEIILLVRSLKKAIDSENFGHDLLASSYLVQILVKVNRAFMHNDNQEPPNIMPVLVQNTIAYIEDHLQEDINLDMLSCKFHYNGAYISRSFKQTTGITIQQYILFKRIGLAQKYLSSGHNVTESCMMSGFRNYANFSRTFSHHTGCSPKKYQSQFIKREKS